MKDELNYYEKIGNWDFSKIKCEREDITDWDFYNKIKEYTNEQSLCLDLGTGGGEKVLVNYPKVGMIIATDFSKKMIETAQKNQNMYPKKNIKFILMDNLNMTFPNNLFDLVSARHTSIDANQIYSCLVKGGALIIKGVDKKDCWELKKVFGRGQAYNDKKAISQIDYENIQEAGFSKIEKVEILQNEFYKTKEDLIALLMKTPILDEYSETNVDANFKHKKTIEEDLLNQYIDKYQKPKGILLKRRLYGIVAIK